MNHAQTKRLTSAVRPTLLLTTGAAGAVIVRRLLVRGLLFKFRRGIAALNAGNYQPVLSSYAEDAVLHFNEGPHRWAGEHRGKPAIASFLKSFVEAGIQGEITELFISGPPWRMTLLARFDDHASASTGEEIYRNRTVLLARTRWDGSCARKTSTKTPRPSIRLRFASQNSGCARPSDL